MKFTQDILDAPRPTKIEPAIILGLQSPTELLPEDARAFLRHAFNHFYHDFANVDLKGHIFNWQYVYRNALLSFRDALLRRGRQMRVMKRPHPREIKNTSRNQKPAPLGGLYRRGVRRELGLPAEKEGGGSKSPTRRPPQQSGTVGGAPTRSGRAKPTCAP